MTAAFTTVCPGIFQLRPVDHYNLTDPTICFERAIKIFLTTTIGYKEIDANLYQQKYAEFYNEMRDLFNVTPDQGFVGRLFDMLTKISRLIFTINVSVIKVIDQNMDNIWDNPELCVECGIHGQQSYVLDWRQTDGHSHYSVEFKLTEEKFKDFRINNEMIRIWFEGSDKTGGLQKFQIMAQQISWEGFQELVDFGHNVRLLLSIEFELDLEIGVDVKHQNLFHMTALYQMIKTRLKKFRDSGTHPMNFGVGHQDFVQKFKVSYIRPQINVNTEASYWSQQPLNRAVTDTFANFDDNTTEDQRQEMIKSQILRKSVKYCDLQIGFRPWHQLNDNVCLCSEWCNWNAFFHFNPIYRFLMVGHNQWFLTNRTTISELYSLAVTEVARVQTNARVFQKTPINRLIYCANNYRKRLANEIRYKNKTSKDEWRVNKPDPKALVAFIYRLSRRHIDFQKLRLQLHSNPLSKVCIDDMQRHLDLLTDLHKQIQIDYKYIKRSNFKQWTLELSTILVNHYFDYVLASIGSLLGSADFLVDDFTFSPDFEYSTHLAKDKDHEKILRVRRSVTNLGQLTNPYNMKVKANHSLSIFISLFNVFTRVDISTSGKDDTNKYQELFQRFDNTFKNQQDNLTQAKLQGNLQQIYLFEFQVIDQIPADKLKSMMTFYTLKLYYYLFGVQQKCMHLLSERICKRRDGWHQYFTIYSFIWSCDMEGSFTTTFANQQLFNQDTFFIELLIKDFYTDFWGLPAHHTQRMTALNEYVSSAFYEYKRLYFWWRNDGNNLFKFAEIIKYFKDTMNKFITQSDVILKQQMFSVIPPMAGTKWDNRVEVLDHLVYYLMKAVCSKCLSFIAKFLNEIYTNLEVKRSTITGATQLPVTYQMTKPGWVCLFRTAIESTDKLFDDLKINYIDYDDEFNRIQNTLTQTRLMVRNIYRQLYTRLCNEWLIELRVMHVNPVTANTVYGLQLLHVSVGLSFAAAFVDQFRCDFNYYRKGLGNLLKVPKHQANSHQDEFIVCRQKYVEYLGDVNAVRQAQPFGNQHWMTVSALQLIYALFDSSQETDVDIDLTAANSP